ncbi:MAG: 30S ribosomal protein S20 [Rickettsia sp.]|nr:30S ribosomal protein S20 [Rickettsia sp.]
MTTIKSLILKNKKRRLINKVRNTSIKNLVKKFLSKINQEGSNYEELKISFHNLQSKIMKAVSKGVFTKNYASRKVSSLCKKLKILENKFVSNDN